MTPTEYTPLGVTTFIVITLIIFAYNNPKGYKKIQPHINNVINLLISFCFGIIIGIDLGTEKVAQDKILFGNIYANIVFISAAGILIHCLIIFLEKIHELKDKV